MAEIRLDYSLSILPASYNTYTVLTLYLAKYTVIKQCSVKRPLPSTDIVYI